jgi:predicted short-subunit dehydrogenase-like oxidoreductase (DUF2520 family)
MNISIIGTGNCATVLGRLCKSKGHIVKQVIGRNIAHAQELANELEAAFLDIKEQPDLDTDLFIIALSDSSMPESLHDIDLKQVPTVHTAGAVSLSILKHTSSNYGVLYPLQSLRKEMKHIPEIPFLFEGNNEETELFIEQFAKTLSDNVTHADDDVRLRLHTAAVVVNNFTNYLYSVAEIFCEKENVDFNLLKPLIKETADRVMENSPRQVQTGPAMRKDITTLDKHLRLLAAHPKIRTLYMRMTDGILHP